MSDDNDNDNDTIPDLRVHAANAHQQEMAAILKSISDIAEMAQHIDAYNKLMAERKFKHFQCLVAEGFTEAQALHIIVSQGNDLA